MASERDTPRPHDAALAPGPAHPMRAGAAEGPWHWQHGLALALRGRCAFCAEVARQPGILAGTACSACGGRFEDPSTADRALEAYRQQSRWRVGTILALASATSLLLGVLFPLLGVVGVSAGLIAFRVSVVSPALQLMARPRRMVSRWMLRMGMAAAFTCCGAVLSLVAAVPVLGGFVAGCATPIVLGLVWWAGRGYLLWQLARERRRQPVSPLERALLGGSMLGVVGLAIATVWLLVAAVEAIEGAMNAVGIP